MFIRTRNKIIELCDHTMIKNTTFDNIAVYLFALGNDWRLPDEDDVMDIKIHASYYQYQTRYWIQPYNDMHGKTVYRTIGLMPTHYTVNQSLMTDNFYELSDRSYNLMPVRTVTKEELKHRDLTPDPFYMIGKNRTVI